MNELNRERLLIIAPHPDDEILGNTGLMLKVRANGGLIKVLFMTVGDSINYTDNGHSTSTTEQRLREIENVAAYIGFDYFEIPFLDHHLQLDRLPRLHLIQACEEAIADFKPTILTTSPEYDYNQDHQAVALAVAAAARPAPPNHKHLPGIVLSYTSVYTAGWFNTHGPNATFWVSLTEEEVAIKATALGMYVSQVRNSGHQRSPEEVAKTAREMGKHIGRHAAEPFISRRIIIE